MLESLAASWWVFLIRGLAAIAFGVIAVFWPGITVGALVIVFGAYAVVDGVFDLMLGIRGTASTGRSLTGGDRVWLVLSGILGVAAGFIAFVWPGITAVALLWVIAFWAVFTGVIELFAAWRLRAELTNEWMWVISGLLSIALGVLLIAQPAEGALALVLWVGILAIAWGTALCVLAFRIRGLAGRPAPV
jgi:uncharacterized membrane protein HdeD (DUF308 family)